MPDATSTTALGSATRHTSWHYRSKR